MSKYDVLIDKKNESAQFMVDEITHICRDLPTRSPGTEGEKVRLVEGDDREVTLPPAEFNLFYVFAHAFHHFMESGLGLRQMCDLALLLEKYGEVQDSAGFADTLKKYRISTKGVVMDPNVFTTLAFVTLDETGDRNFSFARKPGADMMLTTEDLRYSLLRNTKVFHFGTLSMTDEPARAATMEAVRIARESGAMITFDPNYRAPLWKNENDAAEQMLWGVKHADVVKINEEEIRLLLNETPEEGARRLVEKFGVKLVLATMGKKGVFFANKNASGLVFAFTNLKTIDTTGAGDIFGGSAVYKLMTCGKKPEELSCEELTEICRFANAMAGISTTRSGGLPSVPTRFEAEEFLKSLT